MPSATSTEKPKKKKKMSVTPAKQDLSSSLISVSSPGNPQQHKLDGEGLNCKAFKHLLMKHLKPVVYCSGFGHRITDGSLSNVRDLRWKLFVETVKAYDLGCYRTTIDEILVRNESLKTSLAHSLFDMFNTSIKVIFSTRLFGSSHC